MIVAPDSTPKTKLEATRAHGAEVILVPGAREQATRHAEHLAAQQGYVMVPPFDAAHVIAGQGTVGAEVLAEAPDVDTVLVPVSGGGLIAGVATAIKELRPHASVVGVEPELAADAQESFRARCRVEWSATVTGRTSADGLRAAQVGELAFAHVLRYVDDMLAVSEEEIAEAMRWLAWHCRLVAEPSGAVSTAAYLFRQEELPPGRLHVAVLSGGNVDPPHYGEILAVR